MPQLTIVPVEMLEQRRDVRIGELVVKLGDRDPGTRQRAVEDLQRIGRAALPSLQTALKNPDPEVAARAEHLIGRIKASADGRAVQIVREQFGQSTQVVSAENRPESVRQISSLGPNNSKVLMLRDANWLRIVVTCNTAQGQLREEYRARDERELRENHPRVYEVYERVLRQAPSEGTRKWWDGGQ